jgi:hypothetical protein
VKRKSRRGTIALAIAGALILLSVIGIIGYVGYNAVHQPPTFTLAPSSVVAGDTVLVTAKHLPANQTGEIRLHSDVVRFPFRADRSGAVSGEILIPFDSSAGDHLVELCWASRCHVSAILHVLDSGTSPTPGESPSITPGASPAPGSSPSPVAGSSPTPRSTPLPAASPTPTPLPRLISLSPTSTKVGGSVTVSGFNFFPGKTATIYFVQLGNTTQVGTVTVQSSGSFVQPVTIVVAVAGQSAQIRACDAPTSCASQPITIRLT